MARYSMRIAEEAATICAVKACTVADGRPALCVAIGYSLGCSRLAPLLAVYAAAHVRARGKDLRSAELIDWRHPWVWGEAEALLRTGWRP